MSAISWIKLSVNIFDDEKIRLIRSMPEGDAIMLIWIQLLCLAGKTNDGGSVYVGQHMYYTDEMLSTICNQPLTTVRLAIKTFNNFEMISLADDGLITIENWEKHQNIEGMERAREQARIRKQRQREREKQKKLGVCHVTSRDGHATDIDRDIDMISISSSQIQKIIDLWNSLDVNIPKINALNTGTNRYKMLVARIREYDFDTVCRAIANIKQSRFLQGYVNDFAITFDWFVRPNNFIKVLEGNYTDKQIQRPKREREQENRSSHQSTLSESEIRKFEKLKKEVGL